MEPTANCRGKIIDIKVAVAAASYAGGMHIVPALGEFGSNPGSLPLDWLETIRSYIVALQFALFAGQLR
jgi:hypothetical protein